jgi:phosphoglycerate dehydrogenase-like enzyme
MKKLIALFAIAASLVCAQQKKIVAVGLSQEQIEDLNKVSPDVRVVAGVPPQVSEVTAVTADAPDQERQQALLKAVADADAFIGGPTREVIQAGKKLRWVQIVSAGVEPYRYPELLDGKIVVTNGRVVASPGIADHAFAMLLGLTRQMTHFIANRPSHQWTRRDYGLLELEGKTALIIGVGSIGSNVAKRAKGFGMRVIGVDPKELPPNPSVDALVYPDRLDQMIPQADVVFVCAPHTPESEKMFGPKQFELMKRSSYFIAVSRGKLYDLGGLVKALDSKHLAGAGVDVTDPEPLPPNHPLWNFENVIITPHIATQTDHEIRRRMELLRANIARFAKGEQLHNVVEMKRGY